jgi:hypothetical protein
VVNLWEDLLDRAQEIQENEHYVVLECEDKRTHVLTMQGLLCKIIWIAYSTSAGPSAQVHDKIFHGMFADPTTRLKYAQEERRTVHELFDLAAVAEWRGHHLPGTGFWN